MSPASHRHRRRLLPRLGLALASTAVTLVAAELAFRLLEPRLGVDAKEMERARTFLRTGCPAFYEPRPYTAFGLSRGGPGINKLGFSGPDIPVERTPGVPRILCIGASTTLSGNTMGYKGSYPFLLGKIVEERTGKPCEIMNHGVSAWTTAESLISYVICSQDYHPDIVIVHHAVNDVEPRRWPGYRTDFLHFRTSWTPAHPGPIARVLGRMSDLYTYLQMRRGKKRDIRYFVSKNREEVEAGPIPDFVPATAAGFRRNLATLADLVTLRGGRIVLTTMPYDTSRPENRESYFATGTDDNNRIVRELAADRGILLVDLARRFEELGETAAREFLDLCHVTPEGNRIKAEAIADALEQEGLLQ